MIELSDPTTEEERRNKKEDHTLKPHKNTKPSCPKQHNNTSHRGKEAESGKQRNRSK